MDIARAAAGLAAHPAPSGPSVTVRCCRTCGAPRSMAVPLHDRGGRVVAAMNVSSATLTSRAQLQKEVLPRLLAAAAEIDASLRHR